MLKHTFTFTTPTTTASQRARCPSAGGKTLDPTEAGAKRDSQETEEMRFKIERTVSESKSNAL